MRLSVDDGCSSDVRIADLAYFYQIETIFYWPVEWQSLAYANGYGPLLFSEALDLSKNFEIGSHTITHRHLTKIPFIEACHEIEDSKTMLERIFSINPMRPISKFAPPRGYTDDDLTKYTLHHYQLQRLTKEPGLVHVHPNSGANSNVHWLERVNQIEVKELFCHTWELDRYPEEWDNLEKYLRENIHSK